MCLKQMNIKLQTPIIHAHHQIIQHPYEQHAHETPYAVSEWIHKYGVCTNMFY